VRRGDSVPDFGVADVARVIGHVATGEDAQCNQDRDDESHADTSLGSDHYGVPPVTNVLLYCS
jgi:hypothetical protein